MGAMLAPSLTHGFMLEQDGMPKTPLLAGGGCGYASTNLLAGLIPNFRMLSRSIRGIMQVPAKLAWMLTLWPRTTILGSSSGCTLTAGHGRRSVGCFIAKAILPSRSLVGGDASYAERL